VQKAVLKRYMLGVHPLSMFLLPSLPYHYAIPALYIHYVLRRLTLPCVFVFCRLVLSFYFISIFSMIFPAPHEMLSLCEAAEAAFCFPDLKHVFLALLRVD
jgi:hypothetical protein